MHKMVTRHGGTQQVSIHMCGMVYVCVCAVWYTINIKPYVFERPFIAVHGIR